MTDERSCPRCELGDHNHTQFCHYCGWDLTDEGRWCELCGYLNRLSDATCGSCFSQTRKEEEEVGT